MARDPRDESLRKHKEWLGFLQPVGLVVSPPALVDVDCHVNTDVAAEHQQFIAATSTQLVHGQPEPVVVLKDLKGTLSEVFGWQAGDIVPSDDPRAADLVVPLPEYGETLRPSFAVPDDLKAEPAKWLMLVQELPLGCPFDAVTDGDNRKWRATAQARFERLLRETQVPTGLLFNGTEVRLVYAPRGESPGHVTFPIPVMLESGGRPVFAALYMLLREFRVFGAPDGQRLSDVLAASRKYQTTVSTELAKQVLAALYELLRGIQAADAHRGGTLLKEVLAKDPDQVYAGQLTVLLRLVFLLYAEDRGLMSDSEVYVKNYSVTGLFEKLRGDAGRHADTMDQRYGAWSRLITLFRMVHDGAKAGTFSIPARRGYLFDPDRYPFLEGRAYGSKRQPGERVVLPLISDGVLFRVLRNLLILDGERLSYRALDVEQIGSVYEAMMGFRVEVATGRSIAVRPKKAHGAPVTVDLDQLLGVAEGRRSDWFKQATDLKLTPKEAAALKAAETAEDAVAAFDRKVEKAVTPNIVPAGSMVLQPSAERRRSGSHYTPRALTEPIVRKALEPVLKDMGAFPRPEQILDLKICDPAMGSGAFLVEVARQLGDALVKSWHAHKCLPAIPPDEDEVLHAQRLVAQRCLYGVDRNPLAVGLAKLSLWLTTLAKEHPFTFVDHALKCGDSLVGLSLKQIRQFHWKPAEKHQMLFGQQELVRRVGEALHYRYEILDGGDSRPQASKEQKLTEADKALDLVRFAGNLAVAAFFSGDSDRTREAKRTDLFAGLSAYLQKPEPYLRPTGDEAKLREGPHQIRPFHWEVEFPEVFGRQSAAGFDCVVGNPPFQAGRNISTIAGEQYLAWLLTTHTQTTGGADLAAHFFRRAFDLLRPRGTFGMIATNSISQGDTRGSGLRWICNQGGTIYRARRRYMWPGQAAVVVSVIHIHKGSWSGVCDLDGRPVGVISAYLFHAGGNDDPIKLVSNSGKSFQGSIVHGMGLTFDDTDRNGVASPLSVMRELIAKDQRNSERIFPYIGGDEVNDSPTHDPIRYVVNFEEMTLEQSKAWPDLVSHLEIKSKPERARSKSSEVRSHPWWRFWRPRTELYKLIHTLPAVMVSSRHQPNWAVARQEARMVFSEALNIFALPSYSAFCVMQSRPHEVWARFFASSMKDDLRYNPSVCFETYPFPDGYESHSELETVGRNYSEFRAALMVRNNEGLTTTYNRFHDPDEQSQDIIRLRELHDQVDRAVLAAYGPPFSELVVPPCVPILDYEDDEEDEDDTGKRPKKLPYRYRWPDSFRDEVLALLLDLNKKRAEAERSGKAGAPPPKAKKGGRKSKKVIDASQTDLFGG